MRTSTLLYGAAYASVGLSLAFWFIGKGDDSARAERTAIFVGLWPPTLMILGKAAEDREAARGSALKTTAS